MEHLALSNGPEADDFALGDVTPFRWVRASTSCEEGQRLQRQETRRPRLMAWNRQLFPKLLEAVTYGQSATAQ
jgi:hypothetical protein